jgi:hypothetical protein
MIISQAQATRVAAERIISRWLRCATWACFTNPIDDVLVCTAKVSIVRNFQLGPTAIMYMLLGHDAPSAARLKLLHCYLGGAILINLEASYCVQTLQTNVSLVEAAQAPTPFSIRISIERLLGRPIIVWAITEVP